MHRKLKFLIAAAAIAAMPIESAYSFGLGGSLAGLKKHVVPGLSAQRTFVLRPIDRRLDDGATGDVANGEALRLCGAAGQIGAFAALAPKMAEHHQPKPYRQGFSGKDNGIFWIDI